MTYKKITWWLLLIGLLSSAGLSAIVWRVSPFSTYPRLNISAVILFFVAFFLMASSLIALVALSIHHRWPSFSGSAKKNSGAVTAIRQGILFGLATVSIALLALFQMLDIVFVLIIFLIVGLMEGFIQNQR